jgi:hypothetical protein
VPLEHRSREFSDLDFFILDDPRVSLSEGAVLLMRISLAETGFVGGGNADTSSMSSVPRILDKASDTNFRW